MPGFNGRAGALLCKGTAFVPPKWDCGAGCEIGLLALGTVLAVLLERGTTFVKDPVLVLLLAFALAAAGLDAPPAGLDAEALGAGADRGGGEDNEFFWAGAIPTAPSNIAARPRRILLRLMFIMN